MALLLCCLVVCVCVCVQHVEQDSVRDMARFIHPSLFHFHPWVPKARISDTILSNGCSQYSHEKWPPAEVRGHSVKNISIPVDADLFQIALLQYEACQCQPRRDTSICSWQSTEMTETLRLVNVTPLGCMQVSTHTVRGFSPSVAASKSLFSVSSSSMIRKTHHFLNMQQFSPIELFCH